jgi:hypothetical protein
MYEEDDVAVNAEPEDAADPPIDADEPGYRDDDNDVNDDTGGEAEDADGSPERAADGEGLPEPPKKPAQSREDDSRYAAARRAAEAEAQAARERMDAFAQRFGHESFAAMEAYEHAQQYMKDGMPEAAARELAGMRTELEEARRERERAELDRQDRVRWAELFDAFPETRRLDDLPDEVYELIHAGESPVNAYRTYRLRELEGENIALRQNDATRKKAIGSIRGKGPAADRPQPFLDGLFGK